VKDSEHEVAAGTARRFARGEATEEERRQIVRHLLADCAACKAAVRGFLAAPSSYAESFARAQEAVWREVARRTARELLAELDALPYEQRELVVRNSRRFAVPEVAQALVERSYAVRFREPTAMWRDARLAIVAADAAAAAGDVDELLLHDARARAWAALANAHRLRSELPEADRAFAAAFAHQEAGSGDPAVRALLCRLFCSLVLFRRDFSRAAAFAEEAARLYGYAEDLAGKSAALVLVALTRIYAGNPEAAFAPLYEGLELAQRCGDSGLMRDATGNLVLCFINLGRPTEAYFLHMRGQALFEGCAGTLHGLKWQWQGATIERDLGLLAPSANHLVEVREGLLQLGLRVEVADVSLDLAEVYLRLGDNAGVLRTIGETIPIYQALGATRELLAALLELGQAGRQGEQALAVLHDLAGRLRRSYRPEAG
jgi:hypothetical protein